MVVQRRRARVRRARRTLTGGEETPATRVLSGLGRIRDLAGDVLRGRLAREQLLHRVVDRLADGGRVRLIEVELDERRVCARASSTDFMFGSVTEVSAPFLTGRMPPLAPALLATSLVTRNLAKSTASGGASLPNAKPSPPPNCSVACPAPPSTVGNGNQPRSARTASPSFALAANVDGAHWPIRSIAALPLPTVRGLAAGAVPRRGQEARSGTARMSISFLSSSPALTNPGESNEPSSPACAIASLPAIRSDRFAHQNIPGHLSFSPTASGVMPACLERVDVGQELRPGRGRAVDPGLLEQRLAIPDADHAEIERDPVLLAVQLVEAGRGRVEVTDPRLGGLADVLHQARVGLLLAASRRPRTGRCRAPCRPASSS